MAQILSPSQASPFLQRFEGMRGDRVDFDRKWQMVSDYILPRRDFSVSPRPNQLRPHRVTSSVATNANNRMAALVLAYWFDPTRPFLTPNVKRGLVAAGRDTELEPDALDYLGKLEWTQFDRLMLPKAQLMLRAGSMLREFCAFGCGVIWTGRKRGFGPYFQTRPVQACWWSENAEGEIDTLYLRLQMPVHRVIAKWPKAAGLPGWKDLTEAGKASDQTLTPILICVQPRPGGRYGAVVEAKPFSYCVVAEEKGAVIDESGYDSFPYAVFRYDPMPGNAYAEGPGCQVLPDVMVLNHLQQAIENSASQKAEPAIAVPARMFGAKLDRRPGAVNAYNPTGLGLTRADQAILKLDFTGDPTEAIALRKELIADIELGYFVDWLRLRETGDMTAEEVNERRDMRLRGMSSIVANLEAPTSQMGDRSQEIMTEEGIIATPPASLAGVDVDWEYSGPLQVAQLRGNVRSMLQLLDAQALVAKLDPQQAMVTDLQESLRVIGDALAVPTRTMRSRADVAAETADRRRQAEQAANADKLAQVAQAARDGGQGMAAVAGMGGQPAGPAGAAAAPFAPAAPFEDPIAA